MWNLNAAKILISRDKLFHVLAARCLENRLQVQTGKHEKVAKSKSGEKTTAVMATHLKWFIMPPPHSVRQNALMAVVCLSVCPVPDPKLRMKWHSKLKIAKKRVCHGYPGPHLEVKRSSSPGRFGWLFKSRNAGAGTYRPHSLLEIRPIRRQIKFTYYEALRSPVTVQC